MVRFKLALWNSAVLALVLVLFGTALYASFRGRMYGEVDDELTRRVQFVSDSWSRQPFGPPPGGPGRGHGPPPWDRERNPGPNQFEPGVDPKLVQRLLLDRDLLRPRFFDPDGRGIGPDKDSPWSSVAFRSALNGRERFATVVLDGQPVRVLAFPLKRAGKVDAVAQMATSLESSNLLVEEFGRTLMTLLPIALLVTAGAGVLLTQRALKPVAEFARAAETIGAGSLSERIPVRGEDEFALLGGAFNAMLDRLQKSFTDLAAAYEAQRRFTADASHELKTPLTAIKTRVGVALRGRADADRLKEHLEAIGGAADRMNGTIQDLLLLAQTQEGHRGLRRELVSLRDLADEVLAQWNSEEVQNNVPGEMFANVDRKLFGRAIGNLVANGVRHSPPPGAPVVLCGTVHGDRMELRVIDSGEGIASEHLPHLFDRFYRVDKARTREDGGNGLGLAIVKSIVEAHGWTITIASEVSQGTTVTLSGPQREVPRSVEA